jgi:hypothetical protein
MEAKFNIALFPVMIVLQFIMLILSYGNIIPGLPWFVVWFPALVLGILYGVVIIIVILAFLFAGFIALLDRF